MKKAFKLMSVMAMSALLVMSMAACSGNGTNTGNEATTKPDAEKPVLKRLNVWQNEEYNAYPVAKLLEEKTGYKVQYDMLPQDKWAEKLNLIMSSGEAYDIVTSYNDMALYSDYTQKGALVDLTPLIDEFGPNIKAAIKPESLEALKVRQAICTPGNRDVRYQQLHSHPYGLARQAGSVHADDDR